MKIVTNKTTANNIYNLLLAKSLLTKDSWAPYVRLGQGQVRYGQVRQVMSGQVRSGQDRFGIFSVLGTTRQVSSGLGQVKFSRYSRQIWQHSQIYTSWHNIHLLETLSILLCKQDTATNGVLTIVGSLDDELVCTCLWRATFQTFRARTLGIDLIIYWTEHSPTTSYLSFPLLSF